MTPAGLPLGEPLPPVLDLGRARRVRVLLEDLAAAVQRTDPARTAALFAGELDCPDLEACWPREGEEDGCCEE